MKDPLPTGPVTRRREQEVLEVATEIFWRDGYGPASVADVAERLGMLKGSLYHYVESKEDLLWRIIQQAHDEATQILAEIEGLDVTALEGLRIFVERYTAWSLENLERVGLYFREWHNLTGARRDVVRRQRKAFESFVTGRILAAQAAGEAPQGADAHTLMMYVLCAVNSAWTWYRREGPLTPEQVAHRYGAISVATVTGAYHD